MNERTRLLNDQPTGFWDRRTALQKALIALAVLALVAVVVVAIVLTVVKSSPSDEPNNATTTTVGPTSESPTTRITTLGPITTVTTPITPITTVPSVPTTLPTTTTTDRVINKTCDTDMCRVEAQRIKGNMDTSADACEDFYQYACGGYSSNHSLPDDKGRYGTFDEIDENVKRRLQALYAYDYNTTLNLAREAAPLTFVRELYIGCNDGDTLEARGNVPMINLLDSLGGWPLANLTTAFNANAYSWQEALLDIIGKLGNNILLDVDVQPDPNNTSKYIVVIDQPNFGIGRKDLINYHNDSSSTKLVDAYKEFIKSSANAINYNNSADIDKEVDELVDFEIELARASMAPEDRRDHRALYNKFSVLDLGREIPEIDWTHFLQKLFVRANTSVSFGSSDSVVVFDLPYLKHLSHLLLEKTNVSTLANYLGWRVLQINGFMTTKEFRQNEFKFQQTQLGVKKPVELWQRCISYLSNEVPELVGRAYIDRWFTEYDVMKVKTIVNYVAGAYENMLRDNDWLDAETRDLAIEKLKAVTRNVGYPGWVKDDDEITNLFKLTSAVNKQKAFESALYLNRIIQTKEFEKLHDKVDKSHEWPMGPAVVNAAYEPTQNSITLPAGILQLAFFNESRPDYLNYGSIGAVVGHELTHGFDDEGAQYDLNGNLKNWWSEHTEREFKKRADCFIDQYGAIKDDRVGLYLNGNNTVGENIADNGGLREAYDAYKLRRLSSVMPEEGMLPGFEDFSEEQMFFISYANNWCGLVRDEKLRQGIIYDPHSPSKYRVNVPVSNFDKFGEAFSCKRNSSMDPDPSARCILW